MKHNFLEVVGCSVWMSFVNDAAAASDFWWFHQYFDLKEIIYF